MTRGERRRMAVCPECEEQRGELDLGACRVGEDAEHMYIAWTCGACGCAFDGIYRLVDQYDVTDHGDTYPGVLEQLKADDRLAWEKENG